MIALTRLYYLSAIMVSGLIIENALDVYFGRSLKNLGKIHRDHFDIKTIKNIHNNKSMSISLNFIVLSVIIDLIIFTARKLIICYNVNLQAVKVVLSLRVKRQLQS